MVPKPVGTRQGMGALGGCGSSRAPFVPKADAVRLDAHPVAEADERWPEEVASAAGGTDPMSSKVRPTRSRERRRRIADPALPAGPTPVRMTLPPQLVIAQQLREITRTKPPRPK